MDTDKLTPNQLPQQRQISPPVQQNSTEQSTPDETRRELSDAISGASETLVTATTVVPIFPDTIVIDRAMLTVIKRTFLRSAEVLSLRIEDILNINATVGPFLGSIKVVSRVMNAEKPFTVGVFWRSDALRIKRIGQGYIIALQRNIDCSTLPIQELRHMLDKLGQDEYTLKQ